MDCKTISLGLLSYSSVCFFGHFFVNWFIGHLWEISENELRGKYPVDDPIRPHKTISFWFGVIERALFLSCFIAKLPEGIAVWLAFKAVVRWRMSEEKDVRHIPGSPIYMIGTAMNIFFGLLGAYIIYGGFTFLGK